MGQAWDRLVGVLITAEERVSFLRKIAYMLTPFGGSLIPLINGPQGVFDKYLIFRSRLGTHRGEFYIHFDPLNVYFKKNP